MATIGALPAKQGDQARCRVSDEKEHAEAFVLPNVHALVGPQDGQDFVALPEDDVAEGDACKPQARSRSRQLHMAYGERDLECVADTPEAAAKDYQHHAERDTHCAAR